jgi:hypothetical protein
VKVIVLNPGNYKRECDCILRASYISGENDGTVSLMNPQIDEESENYDLAIETLMKNNVTLSRSNMRIPIQNLSIIPTAVERTLNMLQKLEVR